jgi:hypothetical protein
MGDTETAYKLLVGGCGLFVIAAEHFTIKETFHLHLSVHYNSPDFHK